MTGFNFSVVKLNGTALVGIRSPDYQRREKYAPIGTDGTLHQTSNAVIRTAPMASWQTIAVRALVAILNGSTDLPMKAHDATNGLEMIGMQINSAGPGYDATAIHASRKAPRGQTYLSGLSWSPGDVLVASCDSYFISAAGGTDPVTISSTTALPTLSVNTQQLTLTSLVIGGLTITRVQSWEMSIGHKCENNDESVCYNTGLPHPILLTQAGVNGQTEFTMTVDTLDLNGAVTAAGTAVAVFSTINPLDVGVTAVTTTATLNGSLIREEAIQGQPGGRRITVRGTYNGTNLPFALANSA